MNLSIGDGIAVAGCAASLAYTLRFALIGWVRTRAWLRAIAELSKGVDKIVDTLKDND